MTSICNVRFDVPNTLIMYSKQKDSKDFGSFLSTSGRACPPHVTDIKDCQLKIAGFLRDRNTVRCGFLYAMVECKRGGVPAMGESDGSGRIFEGSINSVRER